MTETIYPLWKKFEVDFLKQFFDLSMNRLTVAALTGTQLWRRGHVCSAYCTLSITVWAQQQFELMALWPVLSCRTMCLHCSDTTHPDTAWRCRWWWWRWGLPPWHRWRCPARGCPTLHRQSWWMSAGLRRERSSIHVLSLYEQLQWDKE